MDEKVGSILDRLGVDAGYRTVHEKVITEADIDQFAALSGDVNPVHLDEQYAGKTVFGGRIAHGAFSLSLLSAAMAKLPGVVIFLSQSVRFLKPVRIGDRIIATAEVTGLRRDKGILTLKNVCMNQKGETVVEGEAAVRLFDQPS
jgi:3-hydroxybutyryl-CoA dehydratase